MSDEYLELIASQKATHLAMDVDFRARLFPKNDKYGLSSPMRRAAHSVATNIGKARLRREQFLQLLYDARGSLLAFDTKLSVSFDVGYIEPQCFETIRSDVEELDEILSGLINRFQISPKVLSKAAGINS